MSAGMSTTFFEAGAEVTARRDHEVILSYKPASGIVVRDAESGERFELPNGTACRYLGEVPSVRPERSQVEVLEGEHAGRVVLAFGDLDLWEKPPVKPQARRRTAKAGR